MTLSSNEYEKVLAFFTKAIEQEPHKTSYWCDIGFCKGKLGLWQEAADAFERVVINDPEDPAALSMLGHSYIKLRRHGDAIKVLEKSLEYRADNVKVLYKISAAQFGLGRLPEAQIPLRKILKRYPKHIKANFGLGLVMHYMGEDKEAMQQITTLRSISEEFAERLAAIIRQNND